MKQIFLSKKFFENTFINILVLDEDGKIIDANPSTLKQTGYTLDEIIGESSHIFCTPDHTEEFHRISDETLDREGIWEGELWLKRKDGSTYLVKRSIYKTAHPETKKILFIYFSTDITKSKEKEIAYDEMITKDSLTGLPNKHIFSELVHRAITRSERLSRKTSVFFVDINRFKEVNDSLGYHVGDKLLKEVALRFKELAGEEVLISRYVGDTFSFLVANANDENYILRLIKTIFRSFEREPFIVDGHEVFLSLNMGISFYPNDGTNVEDLCKAANLARARSKEDGITNYQFYTPTLNTEVFEKIVLETQLRKAIDHHEFELYYQPQINISTRKISGFEALIRWKHPEMGMISPALFIPLAEQTGLINQIGDWILLEACTQMKKWYDMGFENYTIAVNISPQQFAQPNFMDTVDAILKKTQLPSELLDLEITESTIVKNINKTIDTLNLLREKGIKISIDDFGTGYSSLNYLVKFPLHSLKIDRSFIQNVHTDDTSASIASMIIAMSHELKLEVIAEGVEYQEHLSFLENVKCEKYQGYLFSPPVNAMTALELLKNEE